MLLVTAGLAVIIPFNVLDFVGLGMFAFVFVLQLLRRSPLIQST